MKYEICEILKITGIILIIGIAFIFMFLITGKFIDAKYKTCSPRCLHHGKRYGKKVFY